MELKTNVLYYGDNLEILGKHIPDESIDLIYLDPPFNSQATYNVLFREPTGELSEAQIKAFSDTWHWDLPTERTFEEIVTGGPPQVARMISALREFVGRNDVMAYLVMMTARLVELHRVLKPTGSLYLHCDPTAGHYLKVVLDTVFGPQNFRNEIVWKRFSFHADAKRFGRVTDRLLFYTKSGEFNFTRLRAPFSDRYVESKFTHVDADGRRFRLSDLNPPSGRGPVYEFHGVTKPWRFTKEKMLQLQSEGRIYTGSKVAQLKRYLDELEGQAVHELWIDVPPINPQAKERLGYPTQKPEALLERIIQASSNEGEVVLDPFCGCGTAIVAAHKLNRQWIGIDITYLAITVMKERLQDSFAGIQFEVVGEPVDLAGARALAKQDRNDFELWALGLIPAKPMGNTKKKGADRGIDGVIGFVDAGKAKRILVQVKSGHVSVAHIRDLRGTMERENAELGLFITLEEPTQPMKTEAVSAGFYHSDLPQADYPRVQIITIEELLAGKQPELPSWAAAGFPKAPKIARKEGEQGEML